MKEMARFDIESQEDRNSLYRIFASNGYAVKVMDIRQDDGLWIGQRVVVYEKEDK
jgi:hypothetical protein